MNGNYPQKPLPDGSHMATQEELAGLAPEQLSQFTPPGFRPYANGNPYFNSAGNLRNPYRGMQNSPTFDQWNAYSNRYNQYQQQQMANGGAMTDVYIPSPAEHFGMPAPNRYGAPAPMPSMQYGGNPSPDGGPAYNPGIPQRDFANGNPFYNARGNLRMRYRDSGMVPNKYGQMVRVPQPGDPDYGMAQPY